MAADSTYQELNCFSVAVDAGVANVLIDHPPINLMDVELMVDLNRLGKSLEQDDGVRVVVMRSADPEFFIAHADLNLILQSRADGYDPAERLTLISHALERFRTMPKISIAQIQGQAYGGGAEFLLAMDLRYAAIGKSRIGFPEASLGLIPGGGGCSRLPDLVGRDRALEMTLCAEGFPAELAERYGVVTRALPADEIDAFVTDLAKRIAGHPAATVQAVKRVMNLDHVSMQDRLIQEQIGFHEVLQKPEASERMQKALQMGMQTREVELRQMEALLAELAK